MKDIYTCNFTTSMNELNDLCSWKHGHLMEVSRNPLKSHWSSCGLCGFLQVQKQHWGLLTWASWRRYVWMHACSQWQCIYTSTQFVAQRSSRTKPKPKKKMTPMLPLRVGLSLYVITKHVWRELRSLEDYCLLSSWTPLNGHRQVSPKGNSLGPQLVG